MIELDSSKHGIDAAQLAIRADEIHEFNRFLRGLYEDLRPAGELQRMLFGQILHAGWNLRIGRREEASILLAFGPAHASLKTVLQFITRAERELHKSLAALRELQTELAYRATLAAEDDDEMPNLPPLVRTAHVHRQVRASLGHLPTPKQIQNKIRLNRTSG